LPGQLAKEQQYLLFEPKIKYGRTKKKHWA